MTTLTTFIHNYLNLYAIAIIATIITCMIILYKSDKKPKEQRNKSLNIVWSLLFATFPLVAIWMYTVPPNPYMQQYYALRAEVEEESKNPNKIQYVNQYEYNCKCCKSINENNSLTPKEQKLKALEEKLIIKDPYFKDTEKI